MNEPKGFNDTKNTQTTNTSAVPLNGRELGDDLGGAALDDLVLDGDLGRDDVLGRPRVLEGDTCVGNESDESLNKNVAPSKQSQSRKEHGKVTKPRQEQSLPSL
jgi:hypothetical protein